MLPTGQRRFVLLGLYTLKFHSIFDAALTSTCCQCLQPCYSSKKIYGLINLRERALLHNLNLKESSQTCKYMNLSSANNSLQRMESPLDNIQKLYLDLTWSSGLYLHLMYWKFFFFLNSKSEPLTLDLITARQKGKKQ